MPILTVTQALTLIALAANAAKSKVGNPEDAFLHYISALVTEGPESDDRRNDLEMLVSSQNPELHTLAKSFIETALKEAE